MAFNALPTPPSNSIVGQLNAAPGLLYQVADSPQFQALCADRGIIPDADDGGRPYLQALSDYGHGVVRQQAAAGTDPMVSHVYGIATSAPLAIYDHTMLSAQRASGEPSFTARASVSRFNGQLRELADAYPTTPSAEVSKAILNAVNITVSDPAVRKAAPHAVQSRLRGANHETGYGQALDYTDRWYAPATTGQDLRGVDWLVEADQPNVDLEVDVKSSLFAIKELGENHKSYAFKSGKIIMHSLMNDADFGGKMALPEHIAEKKAPVIDRLLTQAEEDLNRAPLYSTKSRSA